MGRNRGTVWAVAIALLALFIASTGSAVAVAYQAVRVTDPVNPAYQAHVDPQGRLVTGPPLTEFNAPYFISVGRNAMVGPTTATLAVTRVAAMNTALNAPLANTSFFFQLNQITVGTDGTCYGPGSTEGPNYSDDRLPAAGQLQDSYSSPLVFAPVGGRPYCIGLTLFGEGLSPTTYYLPFAQVTGYVVSGTLSNPAAGSGTRVTSPPKATPGTPRPAGVAPRR